MLIVAQWLFWSFVCFLRWIHLGDLLGCRKTRWQLLRPGCLLSPLLLLMPLAISARNWLLHYRNMRFNHQPQRLSLSQIIFYKPKHINIHFFVNMFYNSIDYFFLDHSIVAMESLHHHKVFSTPLNTVFLVRYVVIHH